MSRHVAGDDIPEGTIVRLCPVDGRVYPYRSNRPRRKPWRVLGLVVQPAALGEQVDVMDRGFCYWRRTAPDGRVTVASGRQVFEGCNWLTTEARDE
jgi:hypothetical protein